MIRGRWTSSAISASCPSPLRGRPGGGASRWRRREAFASLPHPQPLPAGEGGSSGKPTVASGVRGRVLGDVGGNGVVVAGELDVALLAVEQVADARGERRALAGGALDRVGELGRVRS